ncbi:hypothetical protein PR202_gb25045 [Eleusine coracana subsp. coracana]|uniref:Uncharacterized protein n=1 Tax=Eleusine coracana subsp. coracana TaxID=191504 RepID=A0AAV5FP02_ELECO|nr:hypothetical protein PR202_gb25045 [Eleusine coracana subsp. coracana]
MEAKELEEARAKRPVTQIYLEPAEYEDILREVFLQAQEQYTAPASTSALGEDQIEVKIREAKREILLEVEKMLEGKTGKKQATGVLVCQDEITQASTAETKDEIAEIEEKIKKIQQKIEATTKIKYIMNNIHDYLNDHDLHILIILYIGQDYILRWDETRYALSLLHCVAGAVIVTSSTDTQRAKEYCSPPLEPMECSTVGLYHNIVLELKRKQLEQMDEEGDRHIDSHVFRSILDECAPYEFTMKIFVHALYANPKRNNVQLSELHRTLQVSPKSLNSTAMKMIKFSYNNLPEEYKYCLVYLAIFPPGHQIRRSTLIQRWVAEGLITREDWPTSVRQAERCFDALTDHLLVCPADIGVTGEVKSCMVGNVIHQFIAKIAKKQGIMETRCLSHHFSIFNYLRLHSSETICGFLQKLSKSSQLSVKVLDLEGCQCFAGKNKQYLKDICCKILLLKYLSLRRTNITHLPSDINNLHELEVLDIRQTDVPPSATRSFRLLKLKRLLAGLTGVSSVDIPEKVGNMEEMEVLSSVKPRSSEDLKDIGALWHLRKLGVVIEDKSAHLKSLLYAISFPRCLQSLTITLTPSKDKDTPSSGELPNQMAPKIYTPLKHLKSLSIRGTTINKQFLPLLFTNHGQLTKVTLNNTRLGQKDQDILADLPTLHYLRLRYEAYDESTLTFKKKKFRNLKYLLVEGSNITDISFDGGALELEKIVLTFTSLKLTGVQNLTKLWELELNNNTSTNITTTTTTSNFLLSIFKDSIPNIAKLTLRGTLLKQDDLRDFAKESNICCLMLLDKSYVERQLNFNKDEFPTLNLLILTALTSPMSALTVDLPLR